MKISKMNRFLRKINDLLLIAVGFNFSPPTGSPTINFTQGTGGNPSFNAPTGFAAPTAASFSIGSSNSTQPRSRATRARRQR